MDRKKDGKGNLSVDTRRVTTENAPAPDICETRKDPSGLLACASVMPSFQTEALFLAESKLDGSVQTARFLRLYRAFEASFLHYSSLTPDHWRHPRGTWTGSPDLPSVGSCVAASVCASVGFAACASCVGLICSFPGSGDVHPANSAILSARAMMIKSFMYRILASFSLF